MAGRVKRVSEKRMGGNCFNKKSNNNAQGGQSRVNPTPVNSAESNYASAARTIPNGTNVQPQYHGGSDVPVANANAKSSESSVAQRSTRVVPKAPASQPPSVSSDSAAPTTPAKESSCDVPHAISSKGKKKRKEILQKAKAVGSTSDLYNAYKGPEEKKEAVVSSENTVSVSTSGNLKQLPMDTAWTDAIVNEQCGQKKTELDDWEDAADMSTPKLEVSDKTQQVGDGNKVTAKKYSRDFLLKFAGQCTDLPERFEITAGIAEEKKEAVVSSENTKDSKVKTTSKGKKKRREILQKAEAAGSTSDLYNAYKGPEEKKEAVVSSENTKDSKLKTTFKGKKKRKEILQKAKAVGSTSDLYNAYKGPEEKKEAVVSSENTVSVSTSGNLKQLPMDTAWTDAIVNEQCGQKKTELDDWEDAADMSTPKLEVSDKTQQVGDGNKVTAKKYSRDFLLKFAGQCTDLPERFEITAGIAEEKKEAVVSSENTKDSKVKTTSKGKKKRREILQKAEAAGSTSDLYNAYKGPEEKKEAVVSSENTKDSKLKTTFKGKKKRKEILQKAKVVGSTSDLYNAYKGPEEKKEAVVSSENTVSVSTSGNLKQLPMDTAWTDAIVNEQCGQKKTELDDWEDAADMSTPKLEVSDKTQQVGDGNKVTAKKYSRDFLLKFAGQCTDLPERFEITAGIAEEKKEAVVSSENTKDSKVKTTSKGKKKRREILQKAEAAGSTSDLYNAYKGPEEKKEAVVSSENTKDSKLKTTFKGKKKRKEILQKAKAVGSTSDLYNAYKGPEEKKEAVVSSENTVSVSTSGNLKQLPMDAAWTDAIVNEQCGQKKTELDDWEDAADMSTPKLEVSDKTQQVGDGNKVTAKKYSRDFLLKFAGQCTDLPERFEITAGIAEEKKEAVVSSENTKDSKVKTTSKGKKKRREILQKAEAAGSTSDLYNAYKGPEEKKEAVVSSENTKDSKLKTTFKGKKKRREILQKAKAAGSTSDLYNAYKGPEEKKEAVLSSENTVSVSTSGNLKLLPMDAAWTDAIVNELCGQKKTELDDWEDAADMSTPKLEVSDKTQQVGDGSKVTAMKYSRDFLLKFAGQCTDLPEGFEIMAGIAEALMSSNISSHVIERDSHPSTRRITDRSCTKKRRKELQIGQC